MHQNALTAANDNPDGTTTIDAAFSGLIDLAARAEAKRLSRGVIAGSFETGEPPPCSHRRKSQMTKRVVIYARHSSAKQNDVSIEDQFTLTEAYAEGQGWTVVDRFSDKARTGKNAKRPGPIAMFNELRVGANDVLLVHGIDRLSRNLGDTLQFHDLLLLLLQGADLHTVKASRVSGRC